jgi:hypothetical protein
MQHNARQARLFLNGVPVGEVRSDGASGAWGFGHFVPGEGFGKFAPLFGAWSLLIHEDDNTDDSTKEVLEELRSAEAAIDRLRAELLWLDSQERVNVRQLIIDGELVEWNAEGKPSHQESRPRAS